MDSPPMVFIIRKSMRAVVVLLIAVLCATAPVAGRVAPGDPVVGVWYRGTPAGVPDPNDLAAIRALGFTAVVWPSASLAEVTRMAALVDLDVVAVDRSPSAEPSPRRFDVRVASTPATAIVATVWRQI